MGFQFKICYCAKFVEQLIYDTYHRYQDDAWYRK